jgi:hypothetical protein
MGAQVEQRHRRRQLPPVHRPVDLPEDGRVDRAEDALDWIQAHIPLLRRTPVPNA